jgi:hypothetical protein
VNFLLPALVIPSQELGHPQLTILHLPCCGRVWRTFLVGAVLAVEIAAEAALQQERSREGSVCAEDGKISATLCRSVMPFLQASTLSPWSARCKGRKVGVDPTPGRRLLHQATPEHR